MGARSAGGVASTLLDAVETGQNRCRKEGGEAVLAASAGIRESRWRQPRRAWRRGDDPRAKWRPSVLSRPRIITNIKSRAK